MYTIGVRLCARSEQEATGLTDRPNGPKGDLDAVERFVDGRVEALKG